MNCSDFLARFTDYVDGTTSVDEARALDEHARGCDSCGRYRAVVERGATLLRSLPEPRLRDDFEPRLQHRLYHVDDERALTAHQSGAPAMTVLGIAILLAALAWVPVLRGDSSEVVLDPIVVDRAPRRALPFFPVLLGPPGSASTTTPGDIANGLWDDTLLYDYSPLSQRYNQRARVRRVSDFDR